MGKRVVVGLDTSEYSRAAVRMACERAKLYDGVVIGVATIDRPHIEDISGGAPVGAGRHAAQSVEHYLREAHATADRLLDELETTCREAGLGCEKVKREGHPRRCLCEEGLSGDLLVVGTRTFFTFQNDEDPTYTLQQLLRARVVPVLAVPKKVPEVKRVVFPFDGSPQAARAMRMITYQTPQSAIHIPVTLLHVCDDRDEGLRVLAPAVRYLTTHGRKVEVRVEHGSVHNTVLNVVKGLQPALAVVGASSKGPIETLIFGGVSKALIEDGTVLMFISA